MTKAVPRQADTAARLRLAYVTGEYPRATDTFIQREVAALRRLGAHVETFSIRRTGEEDLVGPEQREEQGRTFHVLPAAQSPLCLIRSHLTMLLRSPTAYLKSLGLAFRTARPGVSGLISQFFYFAEAAVLARRLCEREVSHIHNHFADSSCTVSMLASTMSEIPFSFSLHGSGVFFEAYTWRLDEKFRRATFVRCISYFCRSQAMFLSSPEIWERFRVVHCGVDVSSYKAPDVQPNRARIVFIGRLTAAKGLPVLLEAFAGVRRVAPAASLVLIGDGPLREDLVSRTGELGLADAVEFRGLQSQEQVRELLRQADILALPSFTEGLPVVLMEAMAAGIAVVASGIGGISELIEDGISGLLVRPGDPEQLAHCLVELLSDVSRRTRIAEVARKVVERDFDVNIETAKLYRAFREFP